MSTWQILHGDVRERLKDLEPGSVQCVVTSPPYFGLRDYGVPGQIGMEPTPEEFIETMVELFALVRDALRDDGTVWLNMGDSYNGSGKGGVFTNASAKQATNVGANISKPMRLSSMKAKDLIGVPWLLAFALRSDGWYLRSDIIWSKPNPMPESVTDRPTKAHEYLFLLTKSAKYYYNADAIREPYALSTLSEFTMPYHGEGTKDYELAGVQNPSDVKRRILAGMGGRQRAQAKGLLLEKRNINGQPGGQGHNMYARDNPNGANKRSVWTIPTSPYPEAHFATFPEALVEPCILAGSKEGDLILDPFCGSGTTGAVAIRLQRNFVGIELNGEYIKLARKRIGNVAPLLAQEIA